jgi:hypothetical protein
MKHIVRLQSLRILAALTILASSAIVLQAGHRW